MNLRSYLGGQIKDVINTSTLHCSCIQGGWAGGWGNIDTDPLLMPLGDYGGPTITHAIPLDSPAYAISGGFCWDRTPHTDQRGVPRATTGYRAMGAFEGEFVLPLHPADFNGDGFVDEADFAIFEACFTGPAVPYDPNDLPPGCTLVPDGEGFIAADFDRDGDVDHSDFGIFQRCFSGEGNPPDPNCANVN